jgi:hypothetical protein
MIRPINQQYVDRSPSKGLGCGQSAETTADDNNQGDLSRHSSLQSDSGLCAPAASLPKDSSALLPTNDSAHMKLLRRGHILGEASEISRTWHHPDFRFFFVVMFCLESVEDAPPVKLIQRCDRSRVF